MRKSHIILISIFLITAWAISNFFKSEKIATIHPTRGSAIQAVYATGTVEAGVMMPISARTSSRLMELKVDEGSKVTKGQILAQLEDVDLQQTVKQLQAREEFAKKEYKRNELLIKSKSIPEKNYDQAKSDWEAAIAATSTAKAQASYLKLIAPEDGIIIKRDGEIGQLIPASEPVFWLSCCAPLRISTQVDEEDISQVKIGQTTLIRADAFMGQIFNGKVKAITPKGDPISRSYRVRIELTEDTPLLIGMTAETNIIISKKEDAILLPSSAVIQNKVWLVRNSQLTQKEITTGAKNITQTEITDGLSVNDFVVLNPDNKMKEGLKINSILTETSKP